MKFLSIDIGTSAAKCQLFTESGEILEYLRDEYDLMKIDGESYVDTAAILSSVKRFISECAKKHTVDSVAFSSLGESFVLTDAEGNILFHPML